MLRTLNNFEAQCSPLHGWPIGSCCLPSACIFCVIVHHLPVLNFLQDNWRIGVVPLICVVQYMLICVVQYMLQQIPFGDGVGARC